MTIDGTDFPIQEPIPWSSNWWSHKFNGPGLRYEVGVDISKGWIVWFFGPFPCGLLSDLRIFKLKLKTLLLPREKAMADNGYNGDWKICSPKDAKDDHHHEAMATARARHETLNRRLKTWGCLQQKWRHDRSKHHLAFRSIATITQLEIENGHSLFQVDNYKDSALLE